MQKLFDVIVDVIFISGLLILACMALLILACVLASIL